MKCALGPAVRRRSRTRATIFVVLLGSLWSLWSMTSDPIRGAGQAASGGEEPHRHAPPEPIEPMGKARAQADSRVMDAQPRIGNVALIDSDGRAVSQRRAYR